MRATSMLGLLTLTALAACAPARMTLPAALAGEPPMAVQGRQGWQLDQTVRFGGFATEGLERTWVKGAGLRIAAGDRALEADGANQRFRFRLTTAYQSTVDVACRATFRRAGVSVGTTELDPLDRSRLACTLDESGARFTLDLREQYERPLKGTLTGEGLSMAVRGISRIAGALPTPNLTSGYEFVSAERVVGAAEVLNAGRVWIAGSLPRRETTLLAAAAMVVLVREELRAAMDATAQ